MMGSNTNGAEFHNVKVKMGVTRIVFLVGRYAIKIPNFKNGHMNFLNGCLCNCRERDFCKKFIGVQNNIFYDLVAPSIFCSFFGLLQIQKRCNPLKRELTEKEISHFKEICNGDIKRENFGVLNNKLVCLDY